SYDLYITHDEVPNTVHSYWMCSIAVNDPSTRQPLRDHLKEKLIETRPVFYPSHTLPHCRADEKFPVAESISARGINLPSYPGLVRTDVQCVTEAIRSFYEQN